MHGILTLHEQVRTGEIMRRRAETGGGASIHVPDRRIAVATPR
jgi:hypothetical protein